MKVRVRLYEGEREAAYGGYAPVEAEWDPKGDSIEVEFPCCVSGCEKLDRIVVECACGSILSDSPIRSRNRYWDAPDVARPLMYITAGTVPTIYLGR